MQKITTFLTFNDQAEEAVDLYTSVFPNSRVTSTRRYGDAGPGPKGSLMTASFELDGQEFMALNGGPSFSFAQGISLFVQLQGSGRGRRAVGEALRGRREGTLRLAQGQVRRLVADRPFRPR